MSHRIKDLALLALGPNHVRAVGTGIALVLLGALAACDGAESPTTATDAEMAVSATDLAPGAAFAPAAHAAVDRELAAVRRVTAPLHRIEVANERGWDLEVTGCVEHPTEGGMGYHIGNMTYFLNGEANPLEPEVLLYEPGPSGEMRLVGVEYIVPFFAWDPDVNDPPQLFGRDMNRNDMLEQFDLHVWLWKHNPNGVFADWNPRVSCPTVAQTSNRHSHP
jgi:hypothetical protein